MKIGIIGAGWYGCHLASTLIRHKHEVVLYEAGDEVLQRASSLNQARLHAGYHYPRSFATRTETAECFKRFCYTYPQFTKAIDNNIYAVSIVHSVMDFRTYTQIMGNLGLQFTEVNPGSFGLTNIEGALATEERGLDFDIARKYFRENLGSALHLGQRITGIRETPKQVEINGECYDVVINCTWCSLDTGTTVPGLFFEPTTLFYYEATEPFYGALTTMDGNCFSVYPYQNNIYTLSHVKYTPRGQFNNFNAAHAVNENMTKAYFDAIRQQILNEVIYEFPSFLDRFRYLDVQKSIKTKYPNERASRETIVTRHDRVINVLSGKIDTIFVAEDIVLNTVQTLQDSYHPSGNAT
ncbi:MAG: FAD-dependent oxidoreductase [Alphaproteobacteria bacterium]